MPPSRSIRDLLHRALLGDEWGALGARLGSMEDRVGRLVEQVEGQAADIRRMLPRSRRAGPPMGPAAVPEVAGGGSPTIPPEDPQGVPAVPWPASSRFGPHLTVGKARDLHSLAPEVFARHHLHGCQSCVLRDEETLEEGARVHAVDLDRLLGELNALV